MNISVGFWIDTFNVLLNVVAGFVDLFLECIPDESAAAYKRSKHVVALFNYVRSIVVVAIHDEQVVWYVALKADMLAHFMKNITLSTNHCMRYIRMIFFADFNLSFSQLFLN